MVNDMYNAKEVKRYDFGVVIDLLPDMPSRKIRERVTGVRDTAVNNNFYSLEETALKHYEVSMDKYLNMSARNAQLGLAPSWKEPTVSGQKFHLLCTAKGLVVLTHRFNKVKWEVTTALKAGTKVAVLKPYGTPDMVKPVSVADWDLMCERESNPDWAAWMDELDINVTAVLNTATPWLEVPTLGSLAAQFDDFDKFLERLQAEMHNMEATGEWDVDTNTSAVYNEKASVAHYVANKGMDKGKRTCSSSYKYGKKEFWYNYEVLPVDILTKFLHVSYLQYVDYKPLQRIVNDGVEYGTRKYFEFLSEQDMEDGMYEQGLTVTPLYEDPYFIHETPESMREDRTSTHAIGSQAWLNEWNRIS